jgi:hypothetical protein
MDAEQVVFALRNPLFLTVVLQLEYSRRDDSMHDSRLDLISLVYLTLDFDVD